MDFWVVRLLLNLLGYATIFVPGFLLMRYLRSIRYNETAGMILNSIYNLTKGELNKNMDELYVINNI
jgi:hypothetical protein